MDKLSLDVLQECQIIANDYLQNMGDLQRVSFLPDLQDEGAHLEMFFAPDDKRIVRVYGANRQDVAGCLILYAIKEVSIDALIRSKLKNPRTPNIVSGFSIEEMYRPYIAIAAKIFGMGVAIGLAGDKVLQKDYQRSLDELLQTKRNWSKVHKEYSFSVGSDFFIKATPESEAEIHFPLPHYIHWTLRVSDVFGKTRLLLGLANLTRKDEMSGEILRQLVEQNEPDKPMPNILVARWYARAYLNALIYAFMTVLAL